MGRHSWNNAQISLIDLKVTKIATSHAPDELDAGFSDMF